MLCICANQAFCCCFAPSLYTAFFNHAGGNVHQLHGAWMQFARGDVNEKRQGNAPTALTAHTPVGSACNHGTQAGLSADWVKTGFVNRVQRQLPQRFACWIFGEYALRSGCGFVHADEPLRCCAVDYWSFVAPAMWVAVYYVFGSHQAIRCAQYFNDALTCFPNIQATKQRQLVHIATIALYGVQNVIGADAIANTAVKVFHTVCGRRMHDTSAIVGCGVVGQEYWTIALIPCSHIVEWVFEIQ